MSFSDDFTKKERFVMYYVQTLQLQTVDRTLVYPRPVLI